MGTYKLGERSQCPGLTFHLSISHPPTPPQESESCLSWLSPSFGTWKRVMKPASQVLPAQKAPLSSHSPPETQAPILPSPTLSSPKALVLSPSLFQMWQHLAKAEAKLHTPDSGGRRELSESEYTDVLDRSCSQTWKE